LPVFYLISLAIWFTRTARLSVALALRAAFGRKTERRKYLETMPRKVLTKVLPKISRRSFLAASAAAFAQPAVAAPAPPPLDVVIVGAGAAGIAAARRIAAAGRKYVLLEASDRIGGRCITDTRTFGVPYDRGAHWIYLPDRDPVMKAAPRRGLDVYTAPPGQKVRIGRRYAREGELEEFLSAEGRATRAIAEAARKADVPCAQAMPRDLADWRETVEFVLGPFGTGKDLPQLSALDLSRAGERSAAAFCRQGFGTLLAALAEGISVELSTPAQVIDTRRGLTVETTNGTISARTVIITVSTNVIASGALKFVPELPHRPIGDVFGRLSLGSYDHIALELKGNPLGLDSDDLVLEKSSDGHTAALLANVSNTPLCVVDVAGAFGRDVAARGEAAMVAFATDWLAGLYGADVKKAIGRTSATRWNNEPWILGAASAAVPGGAAARRILADPLYETIWFAGEAAHETAWGTVGGAWETGERAADGVLRKLGVVKDQPRKSAPQRSGVPNIMSGPR
jgi:monoamine oxidase